MTLELPELFQRRAALLAGLEGMSFEHFVALAVAEKLSALESVELLRKEMAGAKRKDFERYLVAVLHAEPIETDRMPDQVPFTGMNGAETRTKHILTRT